MHDIVRDYAISRCDDVSVMQRAFISAILDERPPVSSGKAPWPAPWQAGAYPRESMERYTGIHLKWHVQGSVVVSSRESRNSSAPGSKRASLQHKGAAELDSEHRGADEILDRLVAYSSGFAFAVVTALSRDAIDKRIECAERAKEFVKAAQYAIGLATLYLQGSASTKPSTENEGAESMRAIRLLAQAEQTAENLKIEVRQPHSNNSTQNAVTTLALCVRACFRCQCLRELSTSV